MNWTGPSTEPCETLHETGIGANSLPSAVMTCIWSFRHDWNHSSAGFFTRNRRRRTSGRMSWSTVSNGALRSRRTRQATLRSSAARMTSLRTLRTTVSVKWCRRYADYLTEKKLSCFLRDSQHIDCALQRVCSHNSLQQLRQQAEVWYWPVRFDFRSIMCRFFSGEDGR